MPFNFTDVIKTDAGVRDKLKVLQPRKEPPRVVFQSPAAGAPLLKGMVVEVRLLSPSDVFIGDLIDDVPLAFGGLPVSDFSKFIDTHPDAAAILRNDALPDDKRVEFLNTVNTGLGVKSNVADADAAKAFRALKFFVR